MLEKYKTIANKPPVQIYVNKINNGTVFKIKTDYKLKLLSPETMKLLQSAKKDVDQDTDSENVQKLESFEVFYYIVIQSITIINKHLKYYLLLCQIKNLVNGLIYPLIH